MNLQNVKTVHDVLIEVMKVSTDIDSAARSLAYSDFCPSTAECGNGIFALTAGKPGLKVR